MLLAKLFLSVLITDPQPPFGLQAVYVLWPRIDQKTCLKAIVSANLKPVVIENAIEGDELCTDVDSIERAVSEIGPERVVCVCSTTSCFAPRGCDRVVEVAKLCARLGIPHLINNAYGVQSSQLCRYFVIALWWTV